MSDEKRWLEGDAPDGIRELLVAARAEEPGARSAERALVALGVSSAVIAGASHATAAALPAAAASATKGTYAATSLGFFLKWSMVGAVSGVATFGAAHVAMRALEPPKVPPAAVAAAPLDMARATEAVRTAKAPETAPEATNEDVAEAPSVPVAPAATKNERVTAVIDDANAGSGGAIEKTEPSPESRRMLAEVAAVDRARTLLGRGDARGALAALDAYGVQFPERRFEPEALYLRMEAETRLGDVAAARAAATRLIAGYPMAPQAARAKVLLGSLPGTGARSERDFGGRK